MTVLDDVGGDRDVILAELTSSSRRRPMLARTIGSAPALFVLSMALLVLLWYAVIWVFDVAPYLLPTPHGVLGEMVDERELLRDEALVTFWEIAAGFALAALVGFPIGVLIAFSRTAERLLYPPLVTSQAVPKIALAPVFLAWFGFGFRTNMAVAVLIAVFPVIINTVLGLKSLEPDMVRLGHAMGASPFRLFWRIRLPAALPTIFAGLKLAVTFATIGAIIGEFVAGTSGLGYTIQVATGNLATELAFAAIVVISALGLLAFFAIELIERVVLRSHPSRQRAAVA